MLEDIEVLIEANLFARAIVEVMVSYDCLLREGIGNCLLCASIDAAN